MNLVNDITITEDKFEHVSCIVEIPKGANTKYEYNEKYNIFTNIDFVLCASGTVTIELAKALTPMLVLYKLNYVTWYIVKILMYQNS